jgi:hypothetical protein
MVCKWVLAMFSHYVVYSSIYCNIAQVNAADRYTAAGVHQAGVGGEARFEVCTATWLGGLCCKHQFNKEL